MTDERSVATVQFGGIDMEIRDPNSLTPVLCEVLTELRHFGPVFSISLASIVSDGNAALHAQVVARLRLPIEVLMDIHRYVESALAAQAAAKQAAN